VNEYTMEQYKLQTTDNVKNRICSKHWITQALRFWSILSTTDLKSHWQWGQFFYKNIITLRHRLR